MSEESIFFKKTYQEAITLLERAHGYAERVLPSQLDQMAPLDALYTNREVMRVTARLTQIVTWLMAQRAAYNKELSPIEAASIDYRPRQDNTCLAQTHLSADFFLPRALRSLLEDSYNLYVRIVHLADVNARQIEEASPD